MEHQESLGPPIKEIGSPVNTFETSRLPENLESKYWDMRPAIKSLYRKVGLWHGTGRYEDNGDLDVLKGIVDAGAIMPHLDSWDATLKTTETISATKRRSYAIRYSDMHLQANPDELLYKDSRKSHFGRLNPHTILTLARSAPFILSSAYHAPYLYQQITKKYPEWIERKIGQRVENKGKQKLINQFIHGDFRSAIPGDYPILIGLAHNALKPIKTAGYFSTSEVRSNQPVPIDKMNHIEVPLKYIQQTEALFREKGVSIPVLPREFGERYNSEFSENELLTGSGFQESEYPLPENLPSRQLLERYAPQREFFTSPERATSFYHGADHLMRVLLLQETLTNLLIESGSIQPEHTDREALRWGAMAHDIRRHSDFIGRGHANAAANWVLQILPKDVTQETRDKIFAIVKGHDRDIQPDSTFATELAILKDADALDRIRLERILLPHTPEVVRRKVGLDTTRLRFDVSRRLVPFANELYRLSTYDESKRVANPEGAVFDSATQIGALAA